MPNDKTLRDDNKVELHALLDLIRTWVETESGPTMMTISNQKLNVRISIRGYKKIILERTFGKERSQEGGDGK